MAFFNAMGMYFKQLVADLYFIKTLLHLQHFVWLFVIIWVNRFYLLGGSSEEVELVCKQLLYLG